MGLICASYTLDDAAQSLTTGQSRDAVPLLQPQGPSIKIVMGGTDLGRAVVLDVSLQASRQPRFKM